MFTKFFGLKMEINITVSYSQGDKIGSPNTKQNITL